MTTHTTIQPDGSLVGAVTEETDATDAAGNPVLGQRNLGTLIQAGEFPEVADRIMEIEEGIHEAEAKVADLKQRFISGDPDVSLEQVTAAEQAGATARLEAERAKGVARREAREARQARAAELVDQHSASLQGSKEVVDDAADALSVAVANLIEVAEAHNARVHQARADLLAVGVDLPEGSSVQQVTSSVVVDGASYSPVTLSNRNKNVGLIPDAITWGQAIHRQNKEQA